MYCGTTSSMDLLHRKICEKLLVTLSIWQYSMYWLKIISSRTISWTLDVYRFNVTCFPRPYWNILNIILTRDRWLQSAGSMNCWGRGTADEVVDLWLLRLCCIWWYMFAWSIWLRIRCTTSLKSAESVEGYVGLNWDTYQDAVVSVELQANVRPNLDRFSLNYSEPDGSRWSM